jgi:diguanylate cyclase (GGDEF)-like protein
MKVLSPSEPDSGQEETRNLRQIRQQLNDTCLETQALSEIPPPSDPPCLVQIYPPSATTGRRYPVAGESLAIGREGDCGLLLPEGSVSRRPARIWTRPSGEFYVEDLGSRNGTFINDVQIARGLLRDGDFLRVGPFIFRFLAGENVEAQYQAEIHRLAVRDPLTGIHNRRSFDEFLAREAHRARRHGRPLAVAIFEVERSDAIREQVGQRGFDLTLKEMVRRLRHENRAEDMLARFGNSTVAAALPETDLEGALVYAERLRHAAEEKPFTFEECTYRVTVSGGVAVLVVGSEISEAGLLLRAQERLEDAKREGGNRIAPFARVGLRQPPLPLTNDTPPLTELILPANRATA